MGELPEARTDKERIGRYLLGELFWELDQFEGPGTELEPRAAVEVVSCTSYHDMQVRVGELTYQVWLSWRNDVPPRITRTPGQSGALARKSDEWSCDT
jgi:hypothetical protein